MNVNVEISIGEFFDKLTILEIKKQQIKDDSKLVNIITELDAKSIFLLFSKNLQLVPCNSHLVKNFFF